MAHSRGRRGRRAAASRFRSVERLRGGMAGPLVLREAGQFPRRGQRLLRHLRRAVRAAPAHEARLVFPEVMRPGQDTAVLHPDDLLMDEGAGLLPAGLEHRLTAGGVPAVPIDAAIARHQRRTVAITDGRIIADRPVAARRGARPWLAVGLLRAPSLSHHSAILSAASDRDRTTADPRQRCHCHHRFAAPDVQFTVQ
jgi:hypothetical protein